MEDVGCGRREGGNETPDDGVAEDSLDPAATGSNVSAWDREWESKTLFDRGSEVSDCDCGGWEGSCLEVWVDDLAGRGEVRFTAGESDVSVWDREGKTEARVGFPAVGGGSPASVSARDRTEDCEVEVSDLDEKEDSR